MARKLHQSSFHMFSSALSMETELARKLHQSSFHMFSSALSMETEGTWLESFIRVLFICPLHPYRWKLRAYGLKASSEFFSYVLFILIDGN